MNTNDEITSDGRSSFTLSDATDRKPMTNRTTYHCEEMPDGTIICKPAKEPNVEWEVVLSGSHPDICVIVSAPEDATDSELQSLAETEAMSKTYIWSKKRVLPND